MLYMMRNRNLEGTEYGELRDNFVNKRMTLSTSREESCGLIDIDRIQLMEAEIDKIDSQIKELEKQRIY